MAVSCVVCEYIKGALRCDDDAIKRVGGCNEYCTCPNSRAYWIQRLADAIARLQPPDAPPVYARLIPL